MIRSVLNRVWQKKSSAPDRLAILTAEHGLERNLLAALAHAETGTIGINFPTGYVEFQDWSEARPLLIQICGFDLEAAAQCFVALQEAGISITNAVTV